MQDSISKFYEKFNQTVYHKGKLLGKIWIYDEICIELKPQLLSSYDMMDIFNSKY